MTELSFLGEKYSLKNYASRLEKSYFLVVVSYDILRVVFSRHGNSMCQMLNVLCHHFLVCFPVCNCCALSRKTLCDYWRFQMSDEKLLINLKKGWRRHWCINDKTANADALEDESETTLLIRYWFLFLSSSFLCYWY